MLDQVMALKCDETSESHSDNDDQENSIAVQQNVVNDRISTIEDKVDYMAGQIRNILKAIENPSHQ